MGNLREDQYKFLIICFSVLPSMRNISDKNCRENQTHISCSVNFFFEDSAVFEIML
jgi:hypothetical protein